MFFDDDNEIMSSREHHTKANNYPFTLVFLVSVYCFEVRWGIKNCLIPENAK